MGGRRGGLRGPYIKQDRHFTATTGTFPGPQAKRGPRAPCAQLHSVRRDGRGGARAVGAQGAHGREHPSPDGCTGALRRVTGPAKEEELLKDPWGRRLERCPPPPSQTPGQATLRCHIASLQPEDPPAYEGPAQEQACSTLAERPRRHMAHHC